MAALREERQDWAERPAGRIGQENGQHAHDKAEQLTTTVSHENPSRICVVAQETQHASQEQDRQYQYGRIAREVRQVRNPAKSQKGSPRPVRRGRP